MTLAVFVKEKSGGEILLKTYIYMLRCADGSLYTGWTTDVERRLKEHNESPKGAKCTHAKRPCVLVYKEEFEDEDPKEAKRLAMKREWEIKNKLNKKEKEALVTGKDGGKQIKR